MECHFLSPLFFRQRRFFGRSSCGAALVYFVHIISSVMQWMHISCVSENIELLNSVFTAVSFIVFRTRFVVIDLFSLFVWVVVFLFSLVEIFVISELLAFIRRSAFFKYSLQLRGRNDALISPVCLCIKSHITSLETCTYTDDGCESK